MIINWQDVFYITASLTMIAVSITCIWLIWFSFIALRIIKNLTQATHILSSIVGDIGYFRQSIKLTVLNFILKILEKGDKNE